MKHYSETSEDWKSMCTCFTDFAMCPMYRTKQHSIFHAVVPATGAVQMTHQSSNRRLLVSQKLSGRQSFI